MAIERANLMYQWSQDRVQSPMAVELNREGRETLELDPLFTNLLPRDIGLYDLMIFSFGGHNSPRKSGYSICFSKLLFLSLLVISLLATNLSSTNRLQTCWPHTSLNLSF